LIREGEFIVLLGKSKISKTGLKCQPNGEAEKRGKNKLVEVA